MVVMFGNAGGLIACWSYVKKDAPDYLPGNALNVGAACGIVISTILLCLYLRRENLRRDELQRQRSEKGHLEGAFEEEEESQGHRHSAFRYLY